MSFYVVFFVNMFDDKENVKLFGAMVFMICWGTALVYFAYNEIMY